MPTPLALPLHDTFVTLLLQQSPLPRCHASMTMDAMVLSHRSVIRGVRGVGARMAWPIILPYDSTLSTVLYSALVRLEQLIGRQVDVVPCSRQRVLRLRTIRDAAHRHELLQLGLELRRRDGYPAPRQPQERGVVDAHCFIIGSCVKVYL